jgi:hypothetical protein
MNRRGWWVLVLLLVPGRIHADVFDQLAGCGKMVGDGLRKVADERDGRFLGKVRKSAAQCRGGDRAAKYRTTPWVDWANYWGAGDASSKKKTLIDWGHVGPDGRGVDGALLDLEYQRIELIKFNLLDNSGTYRDYVHGWENDRMPNTWGTMRLPPGDPSYAAVGGAGDQHCTGELVRFRNLTGICNDTRNPAMGSSNMLFARNVEFSSTFPELGDDELVRNRHGDRIGPMRPDPQVISRRLFTRQQSDPELCANGLGLDGASAAAECDYQKAPFFNVMAAFWIQFMTHDWFSHMVEGHNDPHAPLVSTGCRTTRENGVERPLTPSEVKALGCRPADVVDGGFVADRTPPGTFTDGHGRQMLERAPRTARNAVTAWWDASQIYGFDEVSRRRVKRDPADRAKLLMVAREDGTESGRRLGYLPLLTAADPQNRVWAGQESVAFGDNYSAGLSFLHNVFAREHNVFVDTFRAQRKTDDSGLRDPAHPDRVITYGDVTDDELFEVARLVVAAEIAKIHTIEWTTQLLYDEPLYLGMNANWNGLFEKGSLASKAMAQVIENSFGPSNDPRTQKWYSAFAGGSGIVGLGSHHYADDAFLTHYDDSKKDLWKLTDENDLMRGVNHFGSPFNFPEEFATVYRLHALVPDLIEFRRLDGDPNAITSKVAVVKTFRGEATDAVRSGGLPNWALSFGRQRLGQLTLQNMPQFLQNLPLKGRIPASTTDRIDVTALDIVRDRAHGLPRFNEFRRQYGLQQLTSFDDFIDKRLEEDPDAAGARAALKHQHEMIDTLRDVYGQHRCDASKVITRVQRIGDAATTDCLGHPDGSMVDNIEDVDVVVGMLSEFARPHGFAISETQFQVFILNASRRLFSDRFFTSSFRPEFYSNLGLRWVNENGPDGKVWEQGEPNGHRMQVSPMKRVLLRAIPELGPELRSVVNAFDPWARDRGEYYSLQWKPRKGAESDPAFGAEAGLQTASSGPTP